MLTRGVVLHDRYLLDDRIATGGMGEVWAASDTLLGRRVAVKVLLPALVSDTEFITRFRTEARLLAALRHPGIVAVHDYREDAMVDGHRVDYLVMEYIEGVPLSKRIRAAGRLGVAETISVLAQAAQALHVAHNANIVHRDVKPSNLLVQPDGSVVLVDFGVARSGNVTSITGTNVVLGTVQYMAPEQIAGRPVSAATDVYALGAVAYSCLTGRPPFPGTNPLHVVTQHLQDAPPALPADVPAPVAALVSRALAKDPAGRYPSAAVFADAARAAQNAASVPPPPPVAPFDAGAAASGAAASGAGADVTTGGLGATGMTGNPVPDTRPELRSIPPRPRTENGWGQHSGRSAAEPSPSAAVGNRRRHVLLAGVAGAVVVALAGVAALVALRPDEEGSSAGPVTKAWVGTSASAEPGDGNTGPAARATATARPSQSAKAPGAPAPSTPSRGAGADTTGGPKPTTAQGGGSASNPHTPGKVCGSGYQVIDSATLTGSDGVQRGKVYLLYNAGNGYNCTVALKSTSIGKATAVSTYLEVQGRTRSTDSGSFAYYAGPVRTKAAGMCVRWGGSAAGVSYNSPFEHCD
ncbi:serine/threonine protein kinase [Plantactinospora sp. S1510]|uniref:non-specific serine/threonine protein kinase n=1 Tax=Plantactinospora alkalitolerans TaxID=2789879 RepID=A0ABS0GT32_9ACTN|nr:serine/threonine protein kinase [Plantactinospora alkalitolerans]